MLAMVKHAVKPLPEIARELKVDAVVEGTVLRSGQQVRITAQFGYPRTADFFYPDSGRNLVRHPTQ